MRDAAFDPKTFVAESFNGYHEGEVVGVTVRFEAPVATVIRERTWHPSQQIRELGAGAIAVDFQTAGPIGVPHWCKSFLPHARILEPLWLAERQREEALEWLDELEKTLVTL